MRIFIFTTLLSLFIASLSMAQNLTLGNFGDQVTGGSKGIVNLNDHPIIENKHINVTAEATYTTEVETADVHAIFDPSSVDPETLPEGMTIVELSGKKYLQVILAGWNSTLKVPEFTLEAGMTAFCEFKYATGAGSTNLISKINGVVQLMDTINTIPNPWGAGMVPSSTGISQSPVSIEFAKKTALLSSTMKVVNQIQFFGQETVSWGPTTGDTLWVGKVRAYVKEEDVVFDPASFDPDLLPQGMKIVDIEGSKYCQIALNGWNSAINVDPFVVTDKYTSMTVTAKYQVGTSGFQLSNINTFLKLANANNTVEVSVGGYASSATLKEYKSAIKTAGTVEMFQVAGQEKTGWSAVKGDTLWVGKVKLLAETPPDPNVIIDPATFNPDGLGTGWEIVTIDGTKYFKITVDGWSSWMNVPAYTFPAGKNAFKAAVKYEVGTSSSAIENMSTFLKFSTSGWSEIGAGAKQATADFTDIVVTLAQNEGNVAGVLQVAAQDRANGFSAVSGAILYIGKITAVTTAPVTFVIDDTKYKMYDGFSIRGSWITDNGIYDSQWNGGVNHTTFSDSSAANPVADNIWEVTINMVADGGNNTWKWGFLDLTDKWLVTGADREFKVVDWTPLTNTYVIGATGVDDLKKAHWNVYPNPAKNQINVNSDIRSIEIYNLVGIKVISTEINSRVINVSSLKPGSYIIKAVTIDRKPIVGRFIKN